MISPPEPTQGRSRKPSSHQIGTSRAGHDAPILRIEEDLLGAHSLARAIQRAIVATPQSWSSRIGLLGRWGTGKTSVLNLLEAMETAAGSVVVRFSAWAASGEAGIILQVYEALAAALESEGRAPSPKAQAKRAASILRRHIDMAAKAGKIVEAAYATGGGFADFAAGVAHTAFAAFAIGKSDLAELLESFQGRRIIVFIDDLDRADPKAIPKTLLALRELLDWQGFTFVIAFDAVVVGRALADYSSVYGENAQIFLEKVIDIPFTIFPPTAAQKLALASHAFENCCPFFPREVLQAGLPLLPNEPRRIKLIARKLSILRTVVGRHEAGDIDWKALLLHGIVDEASQVATAKVVEYSTAKTPWDGFGDSDAEKDQRREQQEKMLLPLFSSNTPQDADRPTRAAIFLIDHWKYSDESQILYQTRLATQEPTLTLREFENLLQRNTPSFDACSIVAAIDSGRSAAEKPREAVAEDLVTLAINHYRSVLTQMSESGTTDERQTQFDRAQNALRFLEGLWSVRGDPDLHGVLASTEVIKLLVATSIQWASWRHDPGDIQLRSGEQEFVLKTISDSRLSAVAYGQTDPFWNSHRKDGRPAIGEWLNRVRRHTQHDVANDLVAWFNVDDGWTEVAKGEDEMTVYNWFIECGRSPLYTEVELTARLLSLLQNGATTDRRQAAARRSNSIHFLQMIIGKSRGGVSWSGRNNPIDSLLAAEPRVLENAWNLAVSLRVPFRMVGSLLRLRSDLVKKGIPDSLLAIPPWLSDASERLQQLSAESSSRDEAEDD